jgi:hypothetical protein
MKEVMGMPVLMGRVAMRMHMLMNEVYFEQQVCISQNVLGRADGLEPVVFRQESNLCVQLINE